MADINNGDRMFCHACGGVWLRNDHGMTCPHCQSDFTEIIEIPPDNSPPTELQTAFQHEHDIQPSSQRMRNPWVDYNPWANVEADPPHDHGVRGYRNRTYSSPDGNFSFTSMTFGGEPRGAPDPLMPMVQSLDTIFHGLADTYQQQGRFYGEPGADPYNDHGHAHERPDGGAGLFPRDANGPQTGPQVGTLGDILELFRADFGRGRPPEGASVMTGPNPMAMLSTLLNFDRRGDAVYSQEEMDRVISQLIDQNVNGGAPGPAPETAIRALPKKKITKSMLGNEGKAECSICMEPVKEGTEVSVLPCSHWFHFSCIEMWLAQHNTCPHCRRGIEAPTTRPGCRPGESRDNPMVINNGSESTPNIIHRPRSDRRRSSAARVHGNGNSSWSGHRVSQSEGNSHERDRRRGSRDSQTGMGSFTNWVRNHFGSNN